MIFSPFERDSIILSALAIFDHILGDWEPLSLAAMDHVGLRLPGIGTQLSCLVALYQTLAVVSLFDSCLVHVGLPLVRGEPLLVDVSGRVAADVKSSHLDSLHVLVENLGVFALVAGNLAVVTHAPLFLLSEKTFAAHYNILVMGVLSAHAINFAAL